MIALVARATGVIRSPKSTLAAVAAEPRWAGILLLTTAIAFLCNAALLRTEVGRVALVDQWERTAIAFGGAVDDTQYGRLAELSEQGVGYAALTALLSGPLLTVAVAAALALLLSLLRNRLPFRQILAIVAHAGVILALRQIVTAPWNYATETLASPTTLVRVAGALDEGSSLARFLGIIDLFVIWWIVVLAIGIAGVARRPARSLALTFTGAYVALAVLMAIAMALSGGTT